MCLCNVFLDVNQRLMIIFRPAWTMTQEKEGRAAERSPQQMLFGRGLQRAQCTAPLTSRVRGFSSYILLHQRERCWWFLGTVVFITQSRPGMCRLVQLLAACPQYLSQPSACGHCDSSFIDPFIQKIQRQRTGALRYHGRGGLLIQHPHCADEL